MITHFIKWNALPVPCLDRFMLEHFGGIFEFFSGGPIFGRFLVDFWSIFGQFWRYFWMKNGGKKRINFQCVFLFIFYRFFVYLQKVEPSKTLLFTMFFNDFYMLAPFILTSKTYQSIIKFWVRFLSEMTWKLMSKHWFVGGRNLNVFGTMFGPILEPFFVFWGGLGAPIRVQ